MKRGTNILVAVLVLAISGTLWAESASVLLEKGLYNEETVGDLDAAIDVYKQIIGDAQANRQYVAQAHYRLGMCHLKKGNKDEAAKCFQQLIAHFSDQESLVHQAQQQLDKIYPAAQAQLPPEVMAYLIEQHRAAYKQAEAKGLHINTHVYGVDDQFNKYFGGFMTFKNQTSRVVNEEIHLGGFSNPPDFYLGNETGVLQQYRVEKRETTRRGKYRLWWKPDRPIKPGEVRWLGYRHRKTQPLPKGYGGHLLKMNNHFGAPVLENFFLVIPYNMAIASQSSEPVSSKRIGIFKILLWQKEVPPDTTNNVDVVLAIQSGYPRPQVPIDYLPLNKVIKRTVYDDGVGKDFLIDLDTGKLFGPPKDLKGSKDAKDAFAWMRAQGIDAGAETASRSPGLWGGDMVVIPLATPRWANVDLAGIRDELAIAQPGTPVIMSALGELPRTYIFKTREGSVGALQILEVVTKPPRHIKIRYKLLQHGAQFELVAHKVVIPDADTKDIGVVLDLATGEMLKAGRPDQFGQFKQLGKGDLAFDRVLICLRGAEPFHIQPAGVGRLTLVEQRDDIRAYEIPAMPCHLLITTAEGRRFDITVLSAEARGIRIEYKEHLPPLTKEFASKRAIFEAAKGFLGALKQGQIDKAYEFTTPQYAKDHTGIGKLGELLNLSQIKIAQAHAGQTDACVITSFVPSKKDQRSAAIGFGLVRHGRQWLIRDVDLLPDENTAKEFVGGFYHANPGMSKIPTSWTSDKAVSDEDKREAENLAAEGWKLWRARKLVEAEGKFGQAVAKDPNNANAWNGLGWAQQNQGKPLNAKFSFEKCLAIEPKHAAALNGLGWIAKGQGKTQEAIGYWEKAVASAPTATAALNGLASTYMQMKNFDKAIRYYHAWYKAEPHSRQAQEGLFTACRRSKPGIYEKLDLSSPESTVKAFMQAAVGGNPEEAVACMLPYGIDYEDVNNLLRDPSKTNPIAVLLAATDPEADIEVVKMEITGERKDTALVAWKIKMKKEVNIGEGAKALKLKPGDTFVLDGTLRKIADFWMIDGI